MEDEQVVTKLTDVSKDILYVMKKPIQLRAVKLPYRVKIETREGALYGEEGDYLIEGIDMEVYPIGESIFLRTYDVLDDDQKPVETPKKDVEREPVEKQFKDDKEEIILAQVVKKNGVISMKHSKSASTFEVYGFLQIYLDALEMDMVQSLEADDNFELF